MLELHPARLLGMLSTEIIARTVVVFERVSSTNDIATGICKRGFGEGWLIVAQRQLYGKGRMGRKWISSRGKGLTFSLIMKFEENGEELTILIALSILEALEKLGVGGILIKWPNDLFLGGKKLCGSLAEASGGRMVLGVGLNVNEERDDFTYEIAGTATSLRIETGRSFDRGEVLAALIDRFEENLLPWRKAGLKGFKERVTDRLLYFGEDVVVTGVDKSMEGRFVGLTDNGRLILRVNDRDHEISSGDMTLRGGK